MLCVFVYIIRVECIVPGGKFEVKSRGLLIHNVTEADNGDYTCRAEVEAEGRYNERKISLVVHSTYTLIGSVNAT